MKTLSISRPWSAAIALLMLLSSGLSHAATFTVSNTNDTGAGSLRQAVTDALGAGVGPHDIQAGGTTGTISLQSVLPTITNSTIRIHGPTSGTLTVTRGVAANFRLFNVSNTGGAATLTLNRLTLTNGNPGTLNAGGGILVTDSALVLNFCTVSNCTAENNGGGLFLEGATGSTCTINYCTFSGNTSTQGTGGGIGANSQAGTGLHTLNVNNSTFSGNFTTVNNGAGIGIVRTTANLRNCTLSGNRAGFNGGGISVGSNSTLNATNCTIANNTTDAGSTGGGGIRASGTASVVNLINTLVVGNVLTGTGAEDTNWGSGGSKTAKNCVVGAHVGTAYTTSTASQIGTTATPKVVNLGALANNGGPNQTHALLTSSPELAINLGSNSDVTTIPSDQRGTGYDRVMGGTVDIGAFETGTAAPSLTGVSPLGAPASSHGAGALTLSNFTVPPGTDRVLVVVASDTNSLDITNVSFGGTAMTQSVERNDGFAVDSIWVLALGTATTATTGNITVTRSGTGDYTFIGAQVFQNVHQTTPVSAALSAEPATNSTTVSQTFGSAAGDLVFDVLDAYRAGSLPTLAPTASNGQAVVHSAGSAIGAGFDCYKTSLKPGAASVNMNWTTSSEETLYLLVNLKQAAVSQPNLSINDVTLSEGNSGTTTFTFTVSLSAPAPAGGVTFDIATADGTATQPGDYTQKSLTSQTIPAGSSTYSFTVLVNGDTTLETNETFFVNVTNVTGATVTDGQGLGTITNDDLSNNADLSALSTTAGSITFAAATIAYAVNVPNATTTTTVTATKADANATLQVQVNSGGFSALTSGVASSALNLNVGANPIDVKVTAQDGTTIKTYTITVTRAAGAVGQTFTTGMAASMVVGQANLTSLNTTSSQSIARGPSCVAFSSTGKMAVADIDGHRVLLWNSIPTTDGQPADVVIGQANFTTTASGLSASALNQPVAVAFSLDGTKLLIADGVNNRVLIFNSIPTTNGAAADVVIGQADFTSNTGTTTQTGLRLPTGLLIAPDGRLLVTDQSNHRVLVFNSIPTANGAAANFVIGQTDFVSGVSGTTSSKFNAPEGTALAPDGRLLVVDFTNHRVLIFSGIPTSNGAAAVNVIGQTTLTSVAAPVTPAANNLDGPFGVAVSPAGQLAIGDFSDHRVLIFNSVPTTNGAAADVVLGQPGTTSDGAYNPGGTSSATNMNRAEQPTFSADGRLWVPGRTMRRVMVFGTASGGGAPEIAVSETGVANIPDNTGTFSFGTTPVGTPVTKTFTVTNTGTATLNLSALSVPSGFTIASNFGSSTVAANGGTTTFQITMDAGAAATPSGTLQFTNDDGDENPYNFTISGTVALPPTNVTITVPAGGITYTLDGTPYIGTQTVPLSQGTHTLATTTPQSLAAGTRAVFSSWSDAGAISHSITVASTPLNITGSFTTQHQLTTTASPSNGGTVTPASGTFFDAGTVVTATATPNSGYIFVGWTAAASGTGAALVTMDAPKLVGANFAATAPEIAVSGNSNNIADGSLLAAATTTNGTDFGSTPVQGGVVEIIYTITNTGTASLNLTGGPSFVSVSPVTDFSVTQQPAATVAAGGGTTTFKIAFNPSAFGVRPGTVSFSNDDGDENPFNFSVQGTGVETPSLVVTTTSDGSTSTDSLTSLREAIAYAATLSGPQTITFSATAAGGAVNFFDGTTHTITLGGTELGITSDLTITAPGADKLTISGNNASRVFNLSGGTTTAMRGLTVADGRSANGAGILNAGNLTMTACTITSNLATGAYSCQGGGITSTGTLRLDGCALINNQVREDVGGNGYGGGLFADGVASQLTNCTISGNSVAGTGAAFNFGGGIFVQTPVTLTNCTVTGNSVSGGATSRGGGIIRTTPGFSVRNSIIAGNTTTSLGPDLYGTMDSLGYNLLGNTASATITGITTGNLLGVSAQLGALANNGGPTLTHALLPSSPAINAGDPAFDPNTFTPPLTTDQRGAGFPRVLGTVVDMGAFEADAPEIAVSYNGNDITDNSSVLNTTIGTDFGSVPVQGVTVQHTFTITNSGTANLTLGTIGLTGSGMTEYAVTQPLTTTVAPSGSTTFTITYDPSSVGTHSALVSFTTNDASEGIFDFGIIGTGTGPQTFDLAGNPVSNTPFDGGDTYIYSTIPPTGPISFTVGGSPSDATTAAGAPDETGAADGTAFDVMNRSGYIAANGTLGFLATITGPGVNAQNNQAYFKDSGTGLKRLVRSGDVMPGVNGASINALPATPVPGLSSQGDVTLLSKLRISTGGTPVSASDDEAMWTEAGGFGLQLLARESDPITGVTGAFINTFAFGCYATATTGVGTGEAAFAIKMKGSTTNSAIIRRSITGAGLGTNAIVARETTAAPGTSETFGGLNSSLGAAVRMDRAGNLAFEAQTKPSNKFGIWYQGNGSSLTKVFAAGDTAPGTSSATFSTFEVPSMGSGGTIAFRAFLNTNGDNATNTKNDGIWRGTVAGVFTPILRRGDAALPGMPVGSKVGNPWSGWLNLANHGAWRGWVDTAGDGISPFPADTYGIYTDIGSTMRLLIAVNDIAPGTGGATLATVDHPVVSGNTAGSEFVAFIGTLSGAGVTAGTNDKAVWRSANGAAPTLLLRTGDLMTTSRGSKTVFNIDIPGSAQDIRIWEQPVMDDTGRLLIVVSFDDGSSAQVIAQ